MTDHGTFNEDRATAMAEVFRGGESDWKIWEIPIKCLACSLHYTIWTENENWFSEFNGGYCPECGVWNGGKLASRRGRKGFIFQHHQDRENGEWEMLGILPPPATEFGTSERSLSLVPGQPGPYGSNEGDIWLAPGSEVQNRLDADGKGLVLVHEILDGEEKLYTTSDEEILSRARAGHERYVAEQASRN